MNEQEKAYFKELKGFTVDKDATSALSEFGRLATECSQSVPKEGRPPQHSRPAAAPQRADPERGFLQSFPGFDPDPTKQLAAEFDRLALDQGWSTKRAAKLAELQALCVELRIPAPQSITKCKEELKNVYVNISDLVDSRRTGQPVEIFTSLEALQHSTLQEGKVFPKEQAIEDNSLKVLLRKMQPEESSSSKEAFSSKDGSPPSKE
ncbi:hypothetical protein H2199_000960 [Coniosporium tulheliwenetii]|uniref:Uncharacterized protein n=1 Tax=Coniosporium tulheliwenetii TaxID=3383036 RepID=A0ACC2ZNF5_9PEZI|nr:hypothetical protein H2199_000960 [Cladosporium sp. JES 115]